MHGWGCVCSIVRPVHALLQPRGQARPGEGMEELPEDTDTVTAAGGAGTPRRGASAQVGVPRGRGDGLGCVPSASLENPPAEHLPARGQPRGVSAPQAP